MKKSSSKSSSSRARSSKLRRLATICTLAAFAPLACKTLGQRSSLNDSSIVTTPAEDQRASSFCWAYALTAYLEQRNYETTRGDASGGFRLNFSEEYLGLVHLSLQLMNGGETPGEGLVLQEGLLLSKGLDVVAKYGMVPEKVGSHELFRAKFDVAVLQAVIDEAYAYYNENGMAAGTPLAVEKQADAVSVVARAAQLTEKQTKFLLAAMGFGPAADATFPYKYFKDGELRQGQFTPQTFAKDYLEFSRDDLFIVKLPEPMRNGAQVSPAYDRSIRAIKKALLYGYSVPISFNFVTTSSQKDGVIKCRKPECQGAEPSTPDGGNAHANHAVLLTDYRNAGSAFSPTREGEFERSMTGTPIEWVIKNSWGFNNNTSSDAALLARFPLPTFTVMSHDFYEASHRLVPKRYEAILPRRVCLRDPEQSRRFVCDPLILASGGEGSLEDEADVSDALNLPLLAHHHKAGSANRYPVVYKKGVAAPSPELMRLETSTEAYSADGYPQYDLAAAEASLSPDSAVNLCARVAVDVAKIKYVAIYVHDRSADGAVAKPTGILSEQNNWQFCLPWYGAESPRDVSLQAVAHDWKIAGDLTVRLAVAE